MEDDNEIRIGAPDDDLEDGEIESDDDDEEPEIVSVERPGGITTTKAAIDIPSSLKTQLSEYNFDNNTNEIGGNTISQDNSGEITDLISIATIISSSPTTVSTTIGGGGAGVGGGTTMKKGKFKRPEIVDDDFAGNIENAIAAALKKDGIEPQFPKIEKRIEESHLLNKDYPIMIKDVEQQQSRSSKGKKRKKRDAEKEKRKKIKHSDDMKITSGGSPQPPSDDIDDYEMLCIRGGSPPPLTIMMNPLRGDHHILSSMQQSGYYDTDDSISSYDSYDSMEYRKMSYEERRQNRRNKDRRQKKNGGRLSSSQGGSGGGGGGNGSTGGGGGGHNDKRRNRDMEMDNDCQRSHEARAQRKLELCKFYLMECCAKKEKCSYMHSDFPCKYYYLGMECVFKGSCKFSHGKPLTEQLRNILLKHIETAPKEILGNFRRISRESATSLIDKTHAKLCIEHGIENTLLPSSSQSQSQLSSSSSSCIPSIMMTNVLPNNGGGTLLTAQMKNVNNNTIIEQNPVIPSLLDMVIKPPIVSPRKDNQMDKEQQKNDNNKPRKSRWCDNTIQTTIQQGAGIVPAGTTTASSTSIGQTTMLPNLLNIPPPSMLGVGGLGICNNNTNAIMKSNQLNTNIGGGITGQALSSVSSNTMNVLSLKNLNGVITPEQIEKLSEIGIETLEQVNQLTVAQLNNFGLSISQINEIQLNSLNIQKLGLISSSSSVGGSVGGIDSCLIMKSSHQTIQQQQQQQQQNSSIFNNEINNKSLSINNQDIDMRFLSALSSPSSSSSLSVQQSQIINIVDDDDKIIKCDTKPESIINPTLFDVGIASPEATAPNSGKDILLQNNTTSSGIIGKSESGGGGVVVVGGGRANGSGNENESDDESTSSLTKTSIVDYSQYLKDSNLNTHKTDLNDLLIDDNNDDDKEDDDDDDDVLNEDEPELLIDETWCASEDEISKIDLTSQKDDNIQINDDNDDSDKDVIIQEQMPLPATYDPKSLYSTSTITNMIDFSSTISNLYSINSNTNNNNNINNNTNNSQDDKKQDQDQRNNDYRDPRLGGYKFNQIKDNYDKKILSNSDNAATATSAAGVAATTTTPTSDSFPKYQRTSIYDGSPINIDDDEQLSNKKADKDMRMSSLFHTTNCDIDLRLPFKPGLSNYTPATEIDGSISSHTTIPYKVYEVEIPKPDYSEIRRSVPVPDKTLDPRLRRIFCLKESIFGSSGSSSSGGAGAQQQDGTGSDSENSNSIINTTASNKIHDLSMINNNTSEKLNNTSTLVTPSLSTICTSGPRIDPRRKRENPELTGSGLTATNKFQNLDIRILLQKSNWYKNLNSKFKIMVNQQLALVSTELKKFHQDQSPQKVFDMQFIMSNQYLQQILTNLGIYIDGNGQILQLDGELDGDNSSTMIGGNNIMGPGSLIGTGSVVMGGGMGMMGGIMDGTGGMGGMLGGPQNVTTGGGIVNGPIPNNMGLDFMRGPPPMNMNQQRFMGTMLPFGPRFGDARPGLLGIAPGIQYNPFDNSGNSGGGMVSGIGQDGGFSSGGPGGNNYNDDHQQQQNYNMFEQQQSGGNNNNSGGGGNFYGRGGGGGGHDIQDNRSNRSGGNRNFRQGGGGGGNNSRANERWGPAGCGGNNGSRNGTNNNNRRNNYDARSGGGGGGGTGNNNNSSSSRDKDLRRANDKTQK